MPFRIIRDNIINVQADAIVNAANPRPIVGEGVDTAIYEAAGRESLLEERRKIGRIRWGDAAATPAFALPAKYVIHTVGVRWHGGHFGERKVLASCYRNSLALAEELGCESIALPLLSAGVYRVPKDIAFCVAMMEIQRFLANSDMDVTLVVFSRDAFLLSSHLMEEVESFIDDQMVEAVHKQEYPLGLEGAVLSRRYAEEGRFFNAAPPVAGAGAGRAAGKRRIFVKEDAQPIPPEPDETCEAAPIKSMMETAEDFGAVPITGPAYDAEIPDEAWVSERSVSANIVQIPDFDDLGMPFRDKLFELIDARGMTDPEVYKRANIDRKLFSKIRSSADYTPKKKTALALAIALELTLEETEDLISRAGYALSPSSRFDMIIKYFLVKEQYDIYLINATLFAHDEQLLGM